MFALIEFLSSSLSNSFRFDGDGIFNFCGRLEISLKSEGDGYLPRGILFKI